ncbi:hypothetical protein ABT160_04555 [Streptomyces sp. NPDC001941]|uniref:hypothetical protein n=1 Tax=Streptomyces sp. NPDC001941 TaxID=3154659 RepID=UPI0033348527
MTPTAIYALGGTCTAIVSALVLIIAAYRTNTARVWREEAEAQKSRADRLAGDLTEIKDRLSRLERENRRLVNLLISLDPERLAGMRLSAPIPEED